MPMYVLLNKRDVDQTMAAPEPGDTDVVVSGTNLLTGAAITFTWPTPDFGYVMKYLANVRQPIVIPIERDQIVRDWSEVPETDPGDVD